MHAQNNAATTCAVALATAIVVLACSSNAFGTCLVDYDAFAPVTGAKWFSEFWEPCVQCCHDVRIGPRGRGGKWVCLDRNITGTGIISFGDGDGLEFERHMSRLGVSVIDVYSTNPVTYRPPAVSGLRVYKEYPRPTRMMVAIHRVRSLHLRVSAVKVDCNGCEFDVFTPSVLDALRLNKAMIVVTMHYPYNKGWLPRVFGRQQALTEAATKMSRLWSSFVNAGYHPYHKEYRNGGSVEYGFIPT